MSRGLEKFRPVAALNNMPTLGQARARVSAPDLTDHLEAELLRLADRSPWLRLKRLMHQALEALTAF